VRSNGEVVCWGKNTYGQLGGGGRSDSAIQVLVHGLADAVRVEVGRDFSCALRRAGGVMCWGNNEDGQLGDGRGLRPGALSLRPVPVSGLSQVEEIATGDYHACARDRNGRVKCWGNGADGQMGNDAQRAFGMPLTIASLAPVRQIASGAAHVCAVEQTGTVKCWGRNTEGQLGDGQSGSKIKPVVVRDLEDAVALGAGHHHSCAIRRAATVVCWGDNAMGQLGPGPASERKRRTPVAVPQLAGVRQIDGGGAHTCVRLQTGRVMCWGANEHGQLGHVAAPRHRAVPTAVRDVDDATGLALGERHTCATRQRGDVKCWGDTEHGTLGPFRLAYGAGVITAAAPGDGRW
jgi:alpha-tubulin suppressor-like RCC1 family protein